MSTKMKAIPSTNTAHLISGLLHAKLCCNKQINNTGNKSRCDIMALATQDYIDNIFNNFITLIFARSFNKSLIQTCITAASYLCSSKLCIVQ